MIQFMFLDDIKVFALNEKETETSLHTMYC